MTDENNLSELLRKRKLKVTPTRLDVLAILANSKNAVPYIQIQESLQKFDRVTLYRTLNSLIEKGIVHKAMVDDNENYYALCNHQCYSKNHNHQHIHFKCNSCAQVTCIKAEQPLVIKLKNYQIDQIEIFASGICQNCQILK